MKMRHIFTGLTILSALAGPAWAAGGVGADSTGPASKFQMAMTIYAGGITLGKMDIDATVRGTDYHAVSNLETSGVVNAFWQAEIQATSSGKLAPKGLDPVLYDSFDIGQALLVSAQTIQCHCTRCVCAEIGWFNLKSRVTILERFSPLLEFQKDKRPRHVRPWIGGVESDRGG